MSKYFDVDCSFPIDAIFDFIKISDERNVVLIWKNGVLIEECSANIMLENAENKYGKIRICLLLQLSYLFPLNKVKLSVRMIDPKSQLNIQNDETKNYLEYTFMKYQLMLHYILLNGGYPTLVF